MKCRHQARVNGSPQTTGILHPKQGKLDSSAYLLVSITQLVLQHGFSVDQKLNIIRQSLETL